MANVFDLLSQAANAPASPTVQTPISPVQPANLDLYQTAAGIGTDRGMLSASQMERDLRTLAPNAFAARYGQDTATNLFGGLQSAASDFRGDVNLGRNRSDLSALGDISTGAASGFLNALAGIANLGVGTVSDTAGATGAEWIQSGNEWVQDTLQSDGLAAARRVQAARSGLSFRDNKFEAEQATAAGNSEISESLKRIGKDTWDTVMIGATDPTMLSQGTADSVGSLLAGGPISKGLKALGGGVSSMLRVESAATGNAARAATFGEASTMPLAIGLMEGGGAYQQSAAQVRGMSFDELQAFSPDFNALIAQGVEPEAARDQIANRTGLLAAGIQAPIAAAAGKLVSRFEAEPFSVPTLRAGLVNTLLKEPIEEGVQSATGQLAQNYAVRQNADNTADLAEGVGEQVGMGALYGATAAGTVQAPGIARRATIEGGRAVYRGTRKLADVAIAAGQPAFAAISDRADRIMKQQEKASPVSEDVLRGAANDLIQNQETDLPAMQAAVEATDATPEQKVQASEYITNLGQALRFDPVAEEIGTLPDGLLKDRLFNATDRVDAVQQAARAITESTNPGEQRFGAAVLNMLMEQIAQVRDADPEALYSLPEGPERDALNRYAKLVNQIDNTPAVRNALSTIRQQAETGQFDEMAPVEDVSTPDNRMRANEVVAVATMTPDHGNVEAINSVLKNSAELGLTPAQVGTLKISANLIRERQKTEKQIANSGLQSLKDVVSSEIVASNDPLRKHLVPSGRQHADRIIKAMKTGDVQKAAAFQQDFGMFVQHMKNKVDALNRSFSDGGQKKSYMALAPLTRQWFDSAGNGKVLHPNLWVDTKSERSMDLAQSIANEQQTLASIFNNINEAFPELGQANIDPLFLVPELNGKPSSLVKKFAEAKAPSKAAETPQAVSAKPETVAEPMAEAVIAEAVQQQQKAKSVTDAVVESPAAEAVVEEVAAEPANPVEELHPDLHTKDFSKSFRLTGRDKPASRIMGEADPFTSVLNALSSDTALRKYTGNADVKHTLTDAAAEAYQSLIEFMAPRLDSALNKSLDSFLSKKNNRERLLSGEDLVSFDDGKALALVEVRDGKISYNESLKNAAILAATQWYLVANNFGATVDPDVIAAQLGVEDSMLLTEETLRFMQHGLSTSDAKTSLSAMIRQFWGVSPQNDALKGYTDGIPEAMAAELLQAMLANNLITSNKPKDGTLPPQIAAALAAGQKMDDGAYQIVTRYTIERASKDSPLRTYPTAIQDAVLTNPPELLFLAGKLPPVPRTQMNNPGVDLTEKQRETLKKASRIKYEANVPLMHFYAAIGKEGFVNGFGAGDLSNKRYNAVHKASLEGRNMMVEASYDAVFDTAAAMSNANNGSLAGAVIRYALNMSRVGRMQMLGKNNPQSNKFMREVVLPTWATLDMNNVDDRVAFTMAVAQHIGQKIHKDGVELSVQKMTAKLLEPETQAVLDYLADWIGKNQFDGNFDSVESIDVADIKQLMEKANLPFTPGSLHAMFEVARLRSMEDQSAFRTGLYIEADGVTNGPINAMLLMSTGQFTKDWVTNVGKGGVSFGGPKSMDQLDQEGLYETSASKTLTNLVGVVSRMKRQKNRKYVMQNVTQLLNLMDLTLKDVTFKNGQLTLDRGIAKNPLTITIYGSGERGIAGKLTEMVMEKIYEMLSNQIQNLDLDPTLTEAQAMFMDDPDADAKYARLTDALSGLTSTAVRISQKGQYYRKEAEGKIELLPKAKSQVEAQRSFNERFVLQGDAKANFEQNMLELFVRPMRKGINETVGLDLMTAVGTLQKVTNIQSQALEYTYQRMVEERIAERKAEDPNYRVTNFLSQKDLNDIDKKLRDMFPLVQSSQQTFQISKSQRIASNRFNYSRALDGTMRTPANYWAPTRAGVMGIAALTIGTGDGMMIQHGVENGIKGLFVFDGINVNLKDARKLNQLANQAVYQSMQGNPLQMVANSFTKFANQAEQIINDLTDEQKAQMSLALFGKLDDDRVATVEEIAGELKYLATTMRRYGYQAQARHTAFTKVATSVDQMAALAQPYHNGVTFDGEMSTDQIVDLLNSHYKDAISQIREDLKQQAAAKATATSFSEVGRVDRASGARLLSQTSIRQLLKTADFTDAQKVIMGEILRSGGAKDYKIVTGSTEQIRAYQEAKKLTGLTKTDNVNGYAVIGEKMIYLINPSAEVLTHELVHASSYNTVLDFYEGKVSDPTVSDAIQRMELMMEDFLNNDIMTTDGAYNEGVTLAMASINDALTNVGMDAAQQQATALNEFMAWALTHQSITQQASKIPSLVQMAKNVVKAIKSLIWGRKKAPAVADDFLSTLQFNASIVIRSQASLASRMTEATLFHKSMGATDRLISLREAFANSVVMQLTREGVDPMLMSQDLGWSLAAQSAARVSNEFGARFDLTAAEQATMQAVVATMATEARLDSNALNRAQELYTQVAKTLKVEDLMDPNAPDYNVELHYAQMRFNAVMGKDVREVDAKGRTTMLSSFIGLAMVSDLFRNALEKMEVTKAARKRGDTLDQRLIDLGSGMMESLVARMSNTHKSKTVLDAMDALTDQLQEVAAAEQEYVQQNIAGNASDAINTWMQGALEKLSDVGIEVGDKLTASNNKFTRLSGRIMKLAAGMATEERGAAVAEGFMDELNKSNIPGLFYQLANDIVGRTDSNAGVYDMIKKVRATAQQLRQEFRKKVPKVINGKFTRELSDAEKATMFKALGKSDIASLLDIMTAKDAVALIEDPTKLNDAISDQQQLIQNEDRARWPLYEKKAKQLADHLMTGSVGSNLLKNAYAIASLPNESVLGLKLSEDGISAIDRLVTLYAIQQMNVDDRSVMTDLLTNESQGVEFTANYLWGQRKGELSKITDDSLRLNHYKGYVPSLNPPGVDMVIADMADAIELRNRGYKIVDQYIGSKLAFGHDKAYFVADIPAKAPYAQGIIQNIRHTVSGVDANTGFSTSLTAGRISDPAMIKKITANLSKDTGIYENYMPLFDAKGKVIAYEMSIHPAMADYLKPSKDLPEMIGVWRGRQVEEKMAESINESLLEKVQAMYDKTNPDAYVNLLDLNSLDPVQKEAVKLFTPETFAAIQKKFGTEFMVRRDVVEDVTGYRNASVGDFFTGNTRWNKDVQKLVKDSLINVFGPDIYPKLIKAERAIQGVVSDIRTHIVVKSIIVPVYNFVSNIYQLIARGVPLRTIASSMGPKTAEISSYLKSLERQIELEAELRAQPDTRTERRLRTEIRSITDSHKRMSIYPLIQAGEFSTIADIGQTAEDLELANGRLLSWVEGKVAQLPGGLKTAARYGIMSKDTALFQGMQKAVQYGDFIAKATVYDDLTKRKGLTSEQALARITEEFVNYDRLPGRIRGALENVGLMWFYNFKIRIAKVALSMIRNNPFHAAVAMGIPSLPGAGLPMEDNVFSKLFSGTLGYSIGPGMAFNAPALNPWYNLLD